MSDRTFWSNSRDMLYCSIYNTSDKKLTFMQYLRDITKFTIDGIKLCYLDICKKWRRY